MLRAQREVIVESWWCIVPLKKNPEPRDSSVNPSKFRSIERCFPVKECRPGMWKPLRLGTSRAICGRTRIATGDGSKMYPLRSSSLLKRNESDRRDGDKSRKRGERSSRRRLLASKSCSRGNKDEPPHWIDRNIHADGCTVLPGFGTSPILRTRVA